MNSNRERCREVLEEDYLRCKYIPKQNCNKNVVKQEVFARLEVDERPSSVACSNVPGSTVYLTLEKVKGRKSRVPWKTFELRPDNFCGVDLGPRERDGKKLVLIFKSDKDNGSTSLLQLKASKYIAHCLKVSDKPDMTRWKDRVLNLLMDKEQHYEVGISEKHCDLPAGTMNLYVLPKRMVLCTLFNTKRSLPECVMDQANSNFDLAYSPGERVYILRIRGESNKKFLRTKTTDDSERIARKFDEFKLSQEFKLSRGTEVSANSRVEENHVANTTESGNRDAPTTNSETNETTVLWREMRGLRGGSQRVSHPKPDVLPTKEICHSFQGAPPMPNHCPKPATCRCAECQPAEDWYINQPGVPPPVPARQQKAVLEVTVAVFAGRPSLGGRWIVDVYVVHPEKNPLAIREALQQCKTSKDHIALPPRRVEVTDTLVIKIPKLQRGWRFEGDTQSKIFAYEEVERIATKRTLDCVLDEGHTFVIAHDARLNQDKFHCQIQIKGRKNRNDVIYNLSTNFRTYAKSGERLGESDVDKMAAEIHRQGTDMPGWLTYKKLAEISSLLTPYCTLGNDWRTVLDYAGFDFVVIDEVERTFARTGISHGELVLRLWCRMKPDEFTEEKLRDAFLKMGREDAVSVLNGYDEEGDGRRCVRETGDDPSCESCACRVNKNNSESWPSCVRPNHVETCADSADAGTSGGLTSQRHFWNPVSERSEPASPPCSECHTGHNGMPVPPACGGGGDERNIPVAPESSSHCTAQEANATESAHYEVLPGDAQRTDSDLNKENLDLKTGAL